jgi:hypothetical protein
MCFSVNTCQNALARVRALAAEGEQRCEGGGYFGDLLAGVGALSWVFHVLKADTEKGGQTRAGL